MKYYTKEELKYVKDMTLSNKEVADALDRSPMAIYCKRHSMALGSKIPKKVTGQKVIQSLPVASHVTRITVNGVHLEVSKNKLTINL
jgi:hypothetical protein